MERDGERDGESERGCAREEGEGREMLNTTCIQHERWARNEEIGRIGCCKADAMCVHFLLKQN